MAVIGTAGHVDHGKSTLAQALTGIDPDRLREEKERGLTIDLGFAWLTLPSGRELGIVDVPGHERFIKNMLAGAGGVDLALLVVAADEGPRPQTREHLAILDLLEVPSGLVVITKCDLVEPGYVDLVEEELAGTLRDSANFTRLDAGYKNNVIPSEATAHIDCRFLPGHQDELLDTIRELAGEHVDLIIDQLGISVDAPRDSAFVASMQAAIQAEDPDAALLPYCLSAGTDNKALEALGIHGYGFVPLKLPADLNFAMLFHGVDERVPVDAVRFGARVLRRLLDDC